MIDYKCSKCGEAMSVPSSLIGENEKCPSCGNVSIVPHPADISPEGIIKNADKPKTAIPGEGPEGIGGWLIFPAIGLVLGPIISLFNLSMSFGMLGMFTEGDMAIEYPGAQEAIVGTSVLVILMVCFDIFVAALFFRKKRSTPKAIIALLAANIIITFINVAWASSAFMTSFDIGELARSSVVAAVWIPYFLLSARVKNTFTE